MEGKIETIEKSKARIIFKTSKKQKPRIIVRGFFIGLT